MQRAHSGQQLTVANLSPEKVRPRSSITNRQAEQQHINIKKAVSVLCPEARPSFSGSRTPDYSSNGFVGTPQKAEEPAPAVGEMLLQGDDSVTLHQRKELDSFSIVSKLFSE